jgi:hypothetical protein
MRDGLTVGIDVESWQRFSRATGGQHEFQASGDTAHTEDPAAKAIGRAGQRGQRFWVAGFSSRRNFSILQMERDCRKTASFFDGQ